MELFCDLGKNLKVKTPEKYNWEPKWLLSHLIDLYLHLDSELLAAALANDQRSFSMEVFEVSASGSWSKMLYFYSPKINRFLVVRQIWEVVSCSFSMNNFFKCFLVKGQRIVFLWLFLKCFHKALNKSCWWSYWQFIIVFCPQILTDTTSWANPPIVLERETQLKWNWKMKQWCMFEMKS